MWDLVPRPGIKPSPPYQEHSPPYQWTWVWANSGRYGGTEKTGVLSSMGLQRVGHDWMTEQQQQQGSSLSGPDVVLVADLGSSVHVLHHLLGTPMGGHAWSRLLQRSWRVWKGRIGGSWEGCDQGGISGWMGCSVHSPAHLLTEFTAIQTEGWAGPKAYRNSVQRFPTEDWSAQPATAPWSVAPTGQVAEWVVTTVSGLKLFFHKLF